MKLTICGSIAFYDQMEALRSELEGMGHEVLIPLLKLDTVPDEMGGKKLYLGKYIEENGGMEAFPPEHPVWTMKENAIRDHYEKIEWGDAIIVVNHEKHGISGYIGGNTLMEMGLAFFLHKPIYILHPVPPELSYKQEILGMKPIVLHGDLSGLRSSS